MRGYADEEIENVFQKYDLNGDGQLDHQEKDAMKADLEGQKAAVNKEYEDITTKLETTLVQNNPSLLTSYPILLSK